MKSSYFDALLRQEVGRTEPTGPIGRTGATDATRAVKPPLHPS